MTHPTVKTIVGEIGRDRLSQRLGVTEYAIRHALSSGVFPSAWFLAVTEMSREAGLTCPVELFNFKSPSSETSLSEGFMMPMVSCLSQDVGTPARNIKGSAA